MTRAILVHPDGESDWVDLNSPDLRDDLFRLLGGLETVFLHEPDGGTPGIKVAINDVGLFGGSVHNEFATRLVRAFGQDWRAAGPVVVMAIDGDRNVIDLTTEWWGWVVNLESGMVAAPPRPADHQVWLFHGADGTSKDAYITPDAARRAAIADYEAGDTGPGTAGVTYTWRVVGSQHLLAEDDTPTGWSVRPIRVLGSSPR